MGKHEHMHKHIYFVRHAESSANRANVWSPSDTPLSSEGLEQAHRVMSNCSSVPFEVILASDYVRTQQTAEHINEDSRVDVVVSELLREWRIPSELIGKDKASEETKKIMAKLQDKCHDARWHHSDEENGYEFRDRVVKALEFIKSREEEHVLVVTHSNTMKMIMTIILHGDEVDPQMYFRFNTILTTRNTGITYARHGDAWELVTWNNFSHLSHVQ